ncbi:MAG TPA: isochorismatase family protein [Acidiferrobacter sp.]|nr:isochorismatase family protein [Acidiferrobacter sp.]
MLIEAHRSQLLLVDLQARLFPAMTPSPPGLLPRILLLVRAAVLLDIPIMVTRQYPQGLGPLLPEIAMALPDDARQGDKMAFSCCADDDLSPLFEGARDQVLIAGVETHVCVLQTAFDLVARGKSPYVLADACASRSVAHHAQALERLSRDGVRVASVESTVFEWLRGAEHPRFRELARTIRDLPEQGG